MCESGGLSFSLSSLNKSYITGSGVLVYQRRENHVKEQGGGKSYKPVFRTGSMDLVIFPLCTVRWDEGYAVFLTLFFSFLLQLYSFFSHHLTAGGGAFGGEVLLPDRLVRLHTMGSLFSCVCTFGHAGAVTVVSP